MLYLNAEYILIVEDELRIRYMLQEVLRELGYKAKSASDGWECLKMVKAPEKPSLILLDYQIPGITGTEVLSMLEIDDATREIPVIMISGTDDIQELVRDYGVSAVLKKPLDLKDLMEAIRNVLGGNLKYKFE